MKNISKLIFAALLTAGLMTAFTKTVEAQQQNAENNSTVNVNCTTGAYGQSNNCYAITNQSINQVMGTTTERQNLYHPTVGASVDGNTFAAGVITMITTAGGAIITLKKKII